MKPDTFIEAARGWLGTPFHHQGRTRLVGADCLGLAYGVARELALIDEQWRPYGREPHAGELETALRDCPALVEVSSLVAGDLIVFRLVRDLQHMGIYTGRNIIHAWQPRGRVVEHRYCDKWQARQGLVFRFKVFQ